jgi:phosphatidylglycerol:prolipoprotein diacylglycerol transferase
MYPDLINIGFLHLKTYGACMAVGFLLCWTVFEKLSNRKDLSNLLVLMMISGVIGSRIWYVIEYWHEAGFANDFWRVFRVDQGGLVFYGGFILAMVAFFGYSIVKKENPLSLADFAVTVLPLGHACGRIGCFFYGCCYGKISDSVLAVKFPAHSPAWYEQVKAGLIPETAPASLGVLPTQLFEATVLLGLFVFMIAVYFKVVKKLSLPSGVMTGLYLANYGIVRFLIEIMRGDPRADVGVFSIGQTVSMVLIATGALLLVWRIGSWCKKISKGVNT